MSKEENVGVTLDIIQADLKTFDKEIERGCKKLENTRKKQTSKLSNEQKKNQKIIERDAKKGSFLYLPRQKINNSSAGPLSNFIGKNKKNTFDDAVEQSLNKMTWCFS